MLGLQVCTTKVSYFIRGLSTGRPGLSHYHESSECKSLVCVFSSHLKVYGAVSTKKEPSTCKSRFRKPRPCGLKGPVGSCFLSCPSLQWVSPFYPGRFTKTHIKCNRACRKECKTGTGSGKAKALYTFRGCCAGIWRRSWSRQKHGCWSWESLPAWLTTWFVRTLFPS